MFKKLFPFRSEAILRVTWDETDTSSFYPVCEVAKKKKDPLPADLAGLEPPAKKRPRRGATGGIKASVGLGSLLKTRQISNTGHKARGSADPPLHLAPDADEPPVALAEAVPDHESNTGDSGDDDEPPAAVLPPRSRVVQHQSFPESSAGGAPAEEAQRRNHGLATSFFAQAQIVFAQAQARSGRWRREGHREG